MMMMGFCIGPRATSVGSGIGVLLGGKFKNPVKLLDLITHCHILVIVFGHRCIVHACIETKGGDYHLHGLDLEVHLGVVATINMRWIDCSCIGSNIVCHWNDICFH